MLTPMLMNLMVAAVTTGGASSIPYARTAVDELSTHALQHDEVLRIRRDFGKPTFEIVVDSWHHSTAPTQISDVRLWWVQPEKDDVRSPFGKRVHKYVDLQYIPATEDAWTVTLTADRKKFSFDVELDESGDARAFADVETKAGTVRHCEATRGRLVARRLLGIPLGIKRLEVQCVDDRGKVHDGKLSYRKVKRGPVYKG